MKKLEFKQYVEYKIYAVTTIKKGYGFRVLLTFADETTMTKQHAGFKTKREANAERDEVVGQLRDRTYVVYDKIRVADFMTYWLEDVMKTEITSDTYDGYKNVIYNYVIPKYGKMYMSTLNQGYITNLYKEITDKYESVARIAKTVMKTALDYAKSKSVVSVNCAIGVSLPKSVKKTEYRVRQIDTQKTMTLPQVLTLIEASKDTPIYMQILFAVLMGLRRGEINGLKYSDVDYINRTLRIKRQLGKKPNSKAEDVAPKMLTKQDIPVKTDSSVRELPIPDLVFEAILEQRKIYEKNRRRRKREFRDWDYICCSSYGNPRSKSYHFKYYKKILAENNLPDITFHQLRNTYSTILMKNDFNVKGISQLMGHAKEIITADVYGDTQEIIEDCLYAIEPFIEEVMPIYNKEEYYDYTDICEMENLTDEYWIAA